MTAIFTVEATRAFDRPAEVVFAHWMDPEARRRWETPEGGGMRCAAFDAREGGREEVVVAPEGREIGRMVTDIRILRDGALAVIQGRGVFGGVVAMTMQTVFRVEPEGGGCRLTGTSQMVVPGAEPTEAQVRAGWEGMLERFEADLAASESG